ncbi:hypothetical protein JOB18_035100, partial [Solea senegalensis]
MVKGFPGMPERRRLGISNAMLAYLTSARVISEPVCRPGSKSDAEWLEENMGPFSQYATYTDLKALNISAVAVLDVLSPKEKAELILDPESGALENETILREVFKGLKSQDDEKLSQFFQAFADINKQRNITFVTNPTARDTILNLTLTALAPEFKAFEPEDFELWFQVNLVSVMASIHPGSLVVIPRNISCASYKAILTGLRQSLNTLPMHLSHDVRSGIASFQETFKRCSLPESLVCKETTVDEDLVCAAVDRSRLEQTLSTANSSEALCNLTITMHACSSASNNSYPSSSTALEARGEVRFANFSQSQLQSDEFVNSWFQTRIPPFLASPSRNFLSCLSSNNFSCQTYQTVVRAFSGQKSFMDRERQQAVFTHFIKPFLSRNGSSDPGCVSSSNGSTEWLQANLGVFSGFATLSDLKLLNPNVSAAESLSAFTPAQMAQLTLTSGASNDTEQIALVFEQLEKGDALESVNEFLTELTADEKSPDFQPVVSDRIMNRTFHIMSPHLIDFNTADWFAWFHIKLVPVLSGFRAVMLTNVAANINCTNYQVVVSGMVKGFPGMPERRRLGISNAMLAYLTSARVISEPVCRPGSKSDAEWLEENMGPFSQYATYTDLKALNISAVAVLDVLSPKEKAELILDPESGALENETILREVFKGLKSQDDEKLSQFFQAFADINKQRNITFVTNPTARDTILNLTLTALAPEFKAFEPEDFELWFQVNLVSVMASIHPGSLVVIPRNISCASYKAILTGLRQSLNTLPMHLSHDVRSGIASFQETFKRCSLPESLVCKETTVDEDLVCAAVDRSRLEQTLSTANSSEALCNLTITMHACSSASNNSYPSSSTALEALGEVRFANFSQSQLQSDEFVNSWFQTRIPPFLASPSRNFLSCLSSNNFSCQTYQTVVRAFSGQKSFMDRERQQAVFTHFIKPFLSRNGSSDPGCVSSSNGSTEWLQANLGVFSGFATLSDLKLLNPNVSAAESLSAFTPAQMAQLTLTSGASNDTEQIDLVFEQLEKGDALESVNEFLTELTADEKSPDFQPVVSDRIMNRTFHIMSPHLIDFNTADWFAWFHIKLVPVLSGFRAVMLTNVAANINCTNYQVVVSGMVKGFPGMPERRRLGISNAMLAYLTSARVISEPVCRPGSKSDAEWLEENMGPFSQYATYTDLKALNISAVAVLDVLSPKEKAELILDPESGALENETILREVFKGLKSQDDEKLSQFFQAFADINKQRNITFVTNPTARDTILNLTLTALAPEFKAFEPEDFELWFQVNLVSVMASIHPGSLVVIPRNISCASYKAILTGLRQSLNTLPMHLSHDVRSGIASFQETFKRCSLPESLVCKETTVDEDLVCAAVDRSRLEQTLSTANSSEALCNLTITMHACSSASNNSYPSSSTALEALGEVRFANFSQSQLQSDEFVNSWFQTRIPPFLASPSRNFLSCLSSNNFSCQTYQTVVRAFSGQKSFMDRERQQAVFTHFIKPFLSRNGSSDPGCVSSSNGSTEWLQANLGVFSGFATLSDLKLLNPNVSAAESLSAFTPAQMAQLTLTSGASNDTEQIDLVFEQLEKGDALESVNEFLTELTADEKSPDFQPVVSDRIMNRTFHIMSPHLIDFNTADWFAWFHIKLVPVLSGFRAVMLTNVAANINCTNYQVV